jgi:hypothetical protein
MDRTRLITGFILAVAASATLTVVPAIAQATGPPAIYSNMKPIPATTPVAAIGEGQSVLHTTILGEIRCTNTFNASVWDQHERGESLNPERGYGEITGWAPSSCTSPQEEASLEAVYHKKASTVVSSEMPLEKEFVEAEFCAEEGVPLPICKERKTGRLISAVRRRVGSVPWKFEMIRGIREEEEAVLAKVGLHEFGEHGSAEQQSTACFAKEKFVNPETAKTEERPVRYTGIPSGCFAIDIIYPQIPLEFVYFGTQELRNLNGFTNGLHPTRWEFPEAGRLFSSEAFVGEGEFTGSLHLSGGEMQLLTAK